MRFTPIKLILARKPAERVLMQDLLGQYDPAHATYPNLWINSHGRSPTVTPFTTNPSLHDKASPTSSGIGGNLLFFDCHVCWYNVPSLQRVGKDNPYATSRHWMYSFEPPN